MTLCATFDAAPTGNYGFLDWQLNCSLLWLKQNFNSIQPDIRGYQYFLVKIWVSFQTRVHEKLHRMLHHMPMPQVYQVDLFENYCATNKIKLLSSDHTVVWPFYFTSLTLCSLLFSVYIYLLDLPVSHACYWNGL